VCGGKRRECCFFKGGRDIFETGSGAFAVVSSLCHLTADLSGVVVVPLIQTLVGMGKGPKNIHDTNASVAALATACGANQFTQQGKAPNAMHAKARRVQDVPCIPPFAPLYTHSTANFRFYSAFDLSLAPMIP